MSCAVRHHLELMFRFAVIGTSFVGLLSLAACGGGDNPQGSYEAAIALADAKEAQARALALDQPCSSVAQCGVLDFNSPRLVCQNLSFIPYSLVSNTAAAAYSAAAEQRDLARLALTVAPSSNLVCPAIAYLPPTLVCEASRCVFAPAR